MSILFGGCEVPRCISSATVSVADPRRPWETRRLCSACASVANDMFASLARGEVPDELRDAIRAKRRRDVATPDIPRAALILDQPVRPSPLRRPAPARQAAPARTTLIDPPPAAPAHTQESNPMSDDNIPPIEAAPACRWPGCNSTKLLRHGLCSRDLQRWRTVGLDYAASTDEAFRRWMDRANTIAAGARWLPPGAGAEVVIQHEVGYVPPPAVVVVDFEALYIETLRRAETAERELAEQRGRLDEVNAALGELGIDLEDNCDTEADAVRLAVRRAGQRGFTAEEIRELAEKLDEYEEAEEEAARRFREAEEAAAEAGRLRARVFGPAAGDAKAVRA